MKTGRVNKWLGNNLQQRGDSCWSSISNPLYEKIEEGKRLSPYSKFYLYKNTLYEYMSNDLYRECWDKYFQEIPTSDSRHYIIKVKFFKEKKIPVNKFELLDLDE